MCYAVKCKQCGKTTWAGCGQHVASVKAGVPAAQWCNGHARASDPASKETVQAGAGLFSRLFGR